MKHIYSLIIAVLLGLCANAYAGNDFESAKEAVANMKVGWNLGNTLDSNSGDTLNMWIEWNPSVKNYETAWGQPQATRALIHMFKEAGFNTIRVPVTWYPHMGISVDFVNNKPYWYRSKWTSSKVDALWMKRVKEVVDYVIDEGMYCILNVHHDTGTSSTHWIIADMDNYNAEHERFESLWTQIATTFKDYDEHLLFEGYNEMTDKANSWCFASFGTSKNYDATMATSAYDAVNSYAQTFVNTVRATGGNNASRNLVVNTYAACSGEGNWNSHLQDPLKKMKLPSDEAEGHIAFEVHAYPSIKGGNLATVKSSVLSMMNNIKTYLGSKAPVIIGEWGTANDGPSSDDMKDYKANKLAISKYFVEQAKAKGFATVYWMGLSDGNSRKTPVWSQSELKDAIIEGYYGAAGYVNAIDDVDNDKHIGYGKAFNLAGQAVSKDYKGIVIKDGRKYLIK